MRISVSLLGTPRVRIDQKEVVFPYRKAEGLFYYLCVRGVVSRDEAIGIFWVDCAENTARKNLRDAVYHLKRIFGENVVESEGNNKIVLSYNLFEPIDYLQITDDTILEQYTEEFLGFFFIKDCLEFELWVSKIRDALDQQYQNALEKAILSGRENRDAKTLVKCAQALLHRHIYEERLYRTIMTALCNCTADEEAISLYQKLCEALQHELETAPEEQTEQLYLGIKANLETRIKNGQGKTDGEAFFCREAEMRAISDELYFFRTGLTAHSILLLGEGGVGKTAILRNLMDIIPRDHCAVFSYQCVQTEEALYLKPWQDIIASIEVQCKNRGASTRLDSRFVSIGEDSALSYTQYEIYLDSLLHTLTCNGDISFAVFILDDIQWLDRASRRLLSSVIHRTKNRRVLFILSGRNDDAQTVQEIEKPLCNANLLRTIHVACFSLEETSRIVRAQQPRLLEGKNALTEIYRNTGGNALFLFEMLREIEHGGSMVSLSKRTSNMIQSRLVDLTDEDNLILECVSIFPRFAMAEELEMITGMPFGKIMQCVKRLLDRQLIRENNMLDKKGWGFQHQLIRDYVYGRIPEGKREDIHRILAEYYEEKYRLSRDISICPMLIYHFDRCKNLYRCYAYQLEYLCDFYTVEHEIYPTVLTAGMTEPIMPPLRGEDELVALAEKIRALPLSSPETVPLRMRMEFLIGRYDLFSGQLKKGLENIHVSIALAKQVGDDKCLFDNYLQIAFYAIQVQNLELFNDYLTSCEELLRKSLFSDADRYTTTRLRGVYYMKQGEYHNAEKIFEDVIRKTEERHKGDPAYFVGLAACYNYIGECCQAENNSEQALTYYLHAIRYCMESKSINSKGVFYTNAGIVLYQIGQEHKAQVYIDMAIHCFEESDALWGRSKAHAYAALLAVRRGEWDEAKLHFDEANKTALVSRDAASLALVDEIRPLIQGAVENGQEKTLNKRDIT